MRACLSEWVLISAMLRRLGAESYLWLSLKCCEGPNCRSKTQARVKSLDCVRGGGLGKRLSAGFDAVCLNCKDWIAYGVYLLSRCMDCGGHGRILGCRGRRGVVVVGRSNSALRRRGSSSDWLDQIDIRSVLATPLAHKKSK